MKSGDLEPLGRIPIAQDCAHRFLRIVLSYVKSCKCLSVLWCYVTVFREHAQPVAPTQGQCYSFSWRKLFFLLLHFLFLVVKCISSNNYTDYISIAMPYVLIIFFLYLPRYTLYSSLKLTSDNILFGFTFFYI